MRRFILLLLLFLISEALAATSHTNKKQWSKRERIDYIQQVMKALLSIDQKSLQDAKEYIDFTDKTNCRSSVFEFKVQCFLATIAQQCATTTKAKQADCLAIYDVLVVTKLSETDFISRRERYRLLQKNKSNDSQAVINTELQKKYAQLASSFGLSKHFKCYEKHASCFSESIDEFCLDQSYRGLFTWQTCSSVLALFVTQK